jgi:hypothetical protein
VSIARILAVATLTLAPTGSTTAQTVLYVDANATGPTHDGSDWCHAFLTLHEALAAAASGTTVRIADGDYIPDTTDLSDPREATFQLINGLTLEGGYAGCEAPDPDERDIEAYDTVLSGDLAGDDGPDFADNDENVCHVVTGSGTDETAVMDGVTISGGNADDSPSHTSGGGMLNADGSPTLIRCTFRRNWAEAGGAGVSNGSGSPTLDNCIFSGNATGDSPSSGGGGMLTGSGSPILTDCTFSENRAFHGGGMFNSHGRPTLTGCTFSGNSAAGSGGGMYNFAYPPGEQSSTLINCTFYGNDAGSHGGGMRNWDSSPTLDNCTFASNLAIYSGGGMGNGGSSNPRLTNCVFIGNGVQSFTIEAYGGGMSNYDNSHPTLINCAFQSNSGVGYPAYGGGMYNEQSRPTLINCTFSSNHANITGGIHNDISSSPTLANCILWDIGDEISNNGGSTITVTHSDVQGGWPGAGNINLDPEMDDLRLSAGSPCIDAGDNSVVTVSTDLDGNWRIFDGDGDGTAIVDMGAYEFGSTAPGTPIPTVSEWGLGGMTLLLVVAGACVFAGRLPRPRSTA